MTSLYMILVTLESCPHSEATLPSQGWLPGRDLCLEQCEQHALCLAPCCHRLQHLEHRQPAWMAPAPDAGLMPWLYSVSMASMSLGRLMHDSLSRRWQRRAVEAGMMPLLSATSA